MNKTLESFYLQSSWQAEQEKAERAAAHHGAGPDPPLARVGAAQGG